MLKDSLNKKTYIGDIEPNPKEFGIWIKEDGSAKIYDYIKNEWKGSSSNDGGSSNIEYLDVSGSEVGKLLCAAYSYQNKFLTANDGISISSAIRNYNTTYIACSICFSDTIIIANDKTTILEALESDSITKEQLDAIPRITKEEFYALT